MNVVMISPGYPAEMPRFTRGLAEVGARVIGVGDQPEASLDPEVRRSLAAYVRVGSLWDEPDVLRSLEPIASRIRFDRVECLWEPGMIVAARIRERFDVPGLTVEQTIPFRDKEAMKQALDRAGIRTPRHARASTSDGVREAAEAIGYPLIIKPIAGAGATNTYRIDDREELETAIRMVAHVPEVSVEEFVDGEEFTFDTVCSDGRVHYYNVCWYRPRPLEGKLKEWISPQAISLRDVGAPELAAGIDMGHAVLKALQFTRGFTHMEWYRKADGEVVFGEIGARPPGARMVDLMNFGSDIDVYRGWAEALCYGRMTQRVRRRYNAAIVFKRARGQGRIREIEGLRELLRDFGRHVVTIDLLPVGSMRRDWQQFQISDGYLIVRHPELQTTMRMADRIGSELNLVAG